MAYIILLIVTFMSALAQILLKMGLNQSSNLFETVSNKIVLVLKLLMNPYVFSGITCQALMTFLYFFALSKLEVSVSVAFQSLYYIMVMIMAYFVFSEQITVPKVLGSLFIIIGIVFFSYESFIKAVK